MDSPFFPALIAFGPFFLILFLSIIVRRGEKPKEVPRAQVVTAYLVCLGVGMAGAVAAICCL
ncbi:MAG: hypothetical protein KDA77_23105 [Planctomycetaceae bacterium]|nr:hypothetical protein [Planctomycetaceae bacterium]